MQLGNGRSVVPPAVRRILAARRAARQDQPTTQASADPPPADDQQTPINPTPVQNSTDRVANDTKPQVHESDEHKEGVEEGKKSIRQRFENEWTLRNCIKRHCVDVFRTKQKLKNRRHVKRKINKEKFRHPEFDPFDKERVTLRDFIYFSHPKAEKFVVPQTTVIRAAKKEENVKCKEKKPLGILAPQLRIAEDGTIVIDEKSLVVDHEPAFSDNGDLIIESGTQRFDNLNCHSYRKFTFTKRWSKQETAKFYKALEIFGTDFGMATRLFPGRTRHEIKRKFNKEDRCHTSLINKALFSSSNAVPDLTCFLPDEKGNACKKRRYGKRSRHLEMPGSDNEAEADEVAGDDRIISCPGDRCSEHNGTSCVDCGSIASSHEELILQSIQRLLADTRNPASAAPSLVFVSNSVQSNDASVESGPADNQQPRSEIAIHLLTNEDVSNEITVRPTSPSHVDRQFNEEQIRQYLGDSESTHSSL